MDQIGLKPITLSHQLTSLGTNVSGGQRQLIFLLRLFFSRDKYDQKIVIFDEPFSSLGKTNTALSLILNDIIQNKIAIVVSHVNISKYFGTTKIVNMGEVVNSAWVVKAI